MRIAFNPSTVEALIAPPNNKDITFDLRGRNIFARGVKFCGTDTNTWRDIKINNVSIGSNTLDLRNGSNTTLTNTNGVVTINSTWRPVVDNLTSDSTTSSLSANLGRILKALIDSKSDSGHNHDDRYLRLTGGWMSGDINFGGDNKIYWGRNTDSASISFKNDGDGDADSYMSFVTSDNGNEYFRWSHSSGSTNTEWMALRSDGLRVGGTKVSLEGHTHDDRYVKKSGDTMLGALNFANGTWNLVGDDSYMGDCNISGHFGIKAANTTYPGIAFFNNSGTHLGNLTAYSGNIKYGAYSLQFLDNGNTSVSASTWTNPFSAYNSNAVADGQAICVWGQSSYLSNLAADSGDMSLWLKRVNAKAATLNMVLDGEYYANGNLRLAHVSEIPNSLKNPHALTISLNGTSQGPYDGSAAKNINITPGSIGAATSGHNHDGRYVYNYGGTAANGLTLNQNALFMSTTSGITGDWWHILQAAWNGEYRWNSLIAFPTLNRNGMYYRSGLDDNTSWGDWVKLLDINNYSSVLDIRYITDITTSVNKLTFTKNGSNIARDITVNNVLSLGRRNPLTERNAISGIYTYGTYSPTDNLAPTSYFETLGFGEGAYGTIEIGGSWISGGKLYWRALRDCCEDWFSWKTILDSSNYSSILDSRYYTESEVNSLLDAKLNRQNLSYGAWNPRGYNLAADYYYNGGDLSISENDGKMYVSIDGLFYQNEGLYRVLDTSDVAGLKNNLTVHLFLSNTDTTWYPLIWGGSSHNNTSDSTGTVYKSYDKLSWQTSSLTLYATNIQTNNIKNLSIGGGIYWNPYVESASDGSDAASITLVRLGVAGGTTLVLSLMNDANNTILFKTNGSARLYHNSYPILTTLNTYVSNNKGYINGTEITLVNNSDKVDNRHAISTTPNTGIIYKAAIYTSSSLTSYWVRLASIPSISLNSEFIATIHVLSGHSNPGRSAILLVYLRGSASSFISKSFKICSNSNYDPNRFRLYYKDSDKTSEIWYQTTGLWDGIITTVISLSSEGSLDERLTLYSGNITVVQTPSMSTYLSALVSTITDNISGNASTATKLQTARTIWGQSFNGTANVDNTLRIRQTTGNYCEGIRIQNGDSTWATIILGATSDSGTNANAWSIHRKSDNNFAISRNSSDGTNGLVMTSTGMGLGTTAPTQRLDVRGNTTITGFIAASSAFINTEDSTLKVYSGRITDAKSDGNICLQTSIDGTDGQSHAYPTQYGARCNLVLLPRGGQVYIGTNPDGGNTTYKLYVNSKIFSNGGFVKNGSSDSYVLLGGGGHKALSDFASSSHSHNYAANENYGGFTKSGRLPISGFYQSYISEQEESGGNAPWSGLMHLINCLHSNTGNNYALLIAASFGNNNTFKIRVTNNNVNNAWRDIIHSGNIGSQTVANTYHLRINSANTWSTWYWSGLSGQPSWLWGSNDGTNMYVWNPSNFRVAYASKAGSVAWDSITGKPSSFTPSSHTHSWTSITDKLVAVNEFNIVNAGFNAGMWFNYVPINDRSKTATITGYHFGNGATGYTSINASGFIKKGSSSNYVLLGDGGHKAISDFATSNHTHDHLRGHRLGYRHLDAGPKSSWSDSRLYIGYNGFSDDDGVTNSIGFYRSTGTGTYTRTLWAEINSNGLWANTRFGVNGQNTGYSFYVNGTSLLNNTVRIQYNTPSLYIRNTVDTSYSIIRLGTNSNENASYIFQNGPSRTDDGGANTMTIRNNVGVLRLQNRVHIDSTGRIYPEGTSSRRTGMYGVYDSYKIGHIWSIGTAYMIPDNGANFGNLYGLAYKHTNNTAGGTMAGGHQAVWCDNGNPRSAMGYNGFWAAGGYYKNGSSNSYVLLGGGGHKIISDFMLKTDELSNNLTTISKSLTVTQAWMDTGIKYTDLPANGTYIIQVSASNPTDSIWSNYWSGIMSWYIGGTNDSETDEIILHRAGHAYHHTIYLRTIMTTSSDGRHLRLQIAADTNLSTAVTYTFKFKRVI